jgi:hypothetical protein
MTAVHVYFKFEGFRGRETFETEETHIDAYLDARDRFHTYAREIGAVRIEGARNAWDQVPIYHGPIITYYYKEPER